MQIAYRTSVPDPQWSALIWLWSIRIWIQYQWNWHLQIFKNASSVPNLIMLWKQHRNRKMFLIFRYKRIEISSKKWKKKCTLLPLPHIGPVSDSSHPQSPQLKIFYSQIVLFLQEMSLNLLQRSVDLWVVEAVTTKAEVLKKLSLAGLAKLSRLRYCWLRFGLALADYHGLRNHEMLVYRAG